MAEEKVIASPEASPVDAAAADSHKRKLEDLELNNAPEPLTEAEPKPDGDSLKNGVQEEGNGDADESEAKRPRLENNGDNVSEADDTVSQNGHQETEKEDEPKEEETEQPESADDSRQSEEGQEPVKESGETITEEPASDENEKPETASADEQGQQTEEVEEPSLPREGDVPVHSTETQPGSDTQILSRKMEVPNDKVGVLIGKAGDTIRSLQDNSGAKIQIMRDADADPRAPTRPLELVGTIENINKAERLIKDVIAEADAGGSPSLVARGFSTVQAASGGEQLELQVPVEKVGLIIGKGGETIRNLQTRSGARIQLIQQSPDGDQSKDRTVRVTGNKKQIDTAREMIKDVMSQTVRPSPLSGGYSQQGYRPRGPVVPQWGARGSHHHAQYSGYDYPQRGPYPSPNSHYPPPSYGNYPPPQAPRGNFGPSWDQRPPASMHGPPPQGNYNYGQQSGPDYGHPPPYSQTPAQPYGHVYNEVKYDNHGSSQHYGHMGSQQTPYAQGGAHSGYGPPDQYGKPPMYGVQPHGPHSQPYGQPRPSQPGEVPYQAPNSAPQSYGQNMPPPQQPYPYSSSGPMQQQTYPTYGSAPSTEGYSHAPPTQGYGQPAAQQPPAYPQSGPTAGYASYPTGYAEQPAAANNAAAYGYQGPTDPAYGGAPQGQAAYPATAGAQSSYPQASQTQPGYDQSAGYGNAPAPAPAGYGKSVSPQTAYAQYDSSQMYGAHPR